MLAVFIIIFFLLLVLLFLLYIYIYIFFFFFFFLPELILRIAGKIANTRTRKTVVPLGSLIMLLPDLTVKQKII